MAALQALGACPAVTLCESPTQDERRVLGEWVGSLPGRMVRGKHSASSIARADSGWTSSFLKGARDGH